MTIGRVALRQNRGCENNETGAVLTADMWAKPAGYDGVSCKGLLPR